MKYMITIIVIVLMLIVGLTLSGFQKGKKIENIKYFEFNYTNGASNNSDVLYSAECNDKCTVIIKPSNISVEYARKIEVSKEKMEEIQNILNKYDVSKWKGFHKTNNNALDGDSFSINIRMNDNSEINASGYMQWPKNYQIVKSELDNLFSNILEEKENEYKNNIKINR